MSAPAVRLERTVRATRRALLRGMFPEPERTVSQWADSFRRLDPKSSPEPGRWRTTRVPYLRKIMDALSPASSLKEVYFQKGSQIGGTETGNNWLGYVIHQAPGPMMYVMPTVETAQRISRQRLDPLFAGTPALRGLVADRKSRDAANTLTLKDFPGGVLIITGANSGVGLRSMPARYLFCDEVDAYPGDVTDEGDPVLLAMRRTSNFTRRKIYLCSTPKNSGSSRIETAMAKAHQLWEYRVPCPFCGELQRLVWGQVKWPTGQPELARYQCIACEEYVEEGPHKTAMLEEAAVDAAGEYLPGAPGARWIDTRGAGGETAGFHASALYSPVGWFSWKQAAAMYEEALKQPALMRVVVNTIFGESYVEASEAPKWRELYARREPYAFGTVPLGAVFLTCGVDVQRNRLEYEVVGWGRGRTSWSVMYGVIEGDPAIPRGVAASPWDRLATEVLAVEWPHATSTAARPLALPIRVMAVDSGYATSDVYAFVRGFPQPAWGPAGSVARTPRTVVAVKGEDKWVAIVRNPSRVDSGRQERRGVKVWPVGSSIAKREWYDLLRLEAPTEAELAGGRGFPPGFVHFPEYADEWFRGITAERLVTRANPRGFPQQRWELDGNERNEPLDSRVYARAAAGIYGLDRLGTKEDKWRKKEREAGLPHAVDFPPSSGTPAAGVVVPAPVVPEVKPPPTPPPPPVEGRPTPPPPPIQRRVLAPSFASRPRLAGGGW